MMKLTGILALLVFFACGTTQSSSSYMLSATDSALVDGRSVDTNNLPKLSTDTEFIERKLAPGFYHAIYIEKNHQSQFYSRLENFTFTQWDANTYQSGHDQVCEKMPNSFHHHNTHGLPSHWLPLYQYKGKFYLYAPSDWGCAGRIRINDSAYVYSDMDGPWPVPLIDVKKVSSDRYEINTQDFYNPGAAPQKLIIHILDSTTQMSVFEFPARTGDARYSLLVPAEKAASFDMIVNYCETEKQMEFKFDDIDFPKLLKGHGE